MLSDPVMIGAVTGRRASLEASYLAWRLYVHLFFVAVVVTQWRSCEAADPAVSAGGDSRPTCEN